MAATAKKYDGMKASKALKPGWRRVKFGDVVRLSKTRCQDPLAEGYERFIGLEHIDPEDLRIRRWGNVVDGVTFTSVFMPGQVLFGKRRAYQRKVAVADFSGVCSGDIYVLESQDTSVLMPELLPFICQTDTFFEHAVGTSAGSLSPRTNWASLADFEFILPPIVEQQRIVVAIGSIDIVLESWLSALSATQTVRLSFLANCFPERLEDRGPLTKSSTIRCLSELADVRTGLALGKKNDKAHLVTRPYLRVANVQDGVLDLTEIKTVQVKADDVQRYQLISGDVLMNEGGDFDKLGRGTVWKGEIADCLHQNHVFAVRPNQNVLRSEFLAALGRSPHGKRYFRSCAKRTSNLASINKKQLNEFPVVFVSMNIQRLIVDQVTLYDQAEKEICERLDSAKQLRAQLLHKIFREGQ